MSEQEQPQPITFFGAGIALGVAGGRYANQVVVTDATRQVVSAQPIGVPIAADTPTEATDQAPTGASVPTPPTIYSNGG